ncbi:MAG: hypothetical protein HUU55_18350 [Myxococcales bacterium]|nr:hypothetical protein [Myxococcales bacterium]
MFSTHRTYASLLLFCVGFACSAPSFTPPRDVFNGDAADLSDPTDTADSPDTTDPPDNTTPTDAAPSDTLPTEDVPEPTIELCANGFDDNDNGLADCADPACFGKPACVESICSDLVDNDKDDLVDCLDPDCAQSDVCTKETCGSYFTCLVEKGCDCTVGKNCPSPESPEYGGCQTNCAINQLCRGRCVDSLSLPMQRNLGKLTACINTHCPNGGGTCLFEYCVSEFAACYLTGTDNCHTFYFTCMNGCGVSESCADGCFSSLSPTGYVDFLNWRGCLIGLCDENEEAGSDSPACTVLGGFVACLPDAGSCTTYSTGGTCHDAATCILGCQSYTDQTCVASCLVDPGITTVDVQPLADLFSCAIETCGTEPDLLIPPCVRAAMVGKCSAFAQKCGL